MVLRECLGALICYLNIVKPLYNFCCRCTHHSGAITHVVFHRLYVPPEFVSYDVHWNISLA